MPEKSLYFEIPAERSGEVGKALVDRIGRGWVCVDGSWDLLGSGYGLFCKPLPKSKEYKARCHIAIEPFVGAYGVESGRQPPRVKLRGDAKVLSPLLEICKSFGLREYSPVASAA